MICISNITVSEFYCTQCGNRGIPIARPSKKVREPGHLKKLYCLRCGRETNHAECRGFGAYTKADFDIEYKCGNFDKDGNRIQPNWRIFVAEHRGD